MGLGGIIPLVCTMYGSTTGGEEEAGAPCMEQPPAGTGWDQTFSPVEGQATGMQRSPEGPPGLEV